MPILVADETVPPSFAKGFEMLNALGPAVPGTNASWRKLENHGVHDSQVLRQLSGSMQGNAWFVSVPSDSSRMAIHFGNVVPQKFESEELPPDGSLEKDITLIIEAVSKLERVSDLDDFSRPWGDGGSRTFGPLMVFAAQLHQAGHPKLADQLAWTLFQAAPARSAVIDAALDHLGNELYSDAINRFFESHDWQTYRDELTTLIEKLPRGWQAQPAAILALESITLRVENPVPPKPELDGVAITSDARKAIAWMTTPPATTDSAPPIPPELAEMLNQIPPEYRAQFLEHHGHGGAGNTLSNPGFWLLHAADSPVDHTGPAAGLLALGLEAIPVLAALATDSFPTHFPNPAGSRSSYSYGRTAAARALETYASMVRPATRSDIARMLLTPILPDERGQLRRADHHAIRDIAVEFYRANKGKDSGQLAAVYLGEGDENQKTQAANFLANSSDPEHHRIFENHILNSTPATGNLAAVITYAQRRKTAAKPLLDKFLPLVRDEVGDGTNVEDNRNLSWQFRQPGQLNQTLRQLEAIAEGKSPLDSAREIASGPPEEAAPAVRALLQNLASEPADDQLEVLLAGALAAEDAQVRFTFLSPMFQMRHHFEADDDEEEEEEDQETQPTIPDPIREAWAVLVADDRQLDPDWLTNTYFSADTIAEFAAMALESRIHPGGVHELYQATNILKKSLAEICMTRMKARMADEPVPPLPDPENVTSERLREIVTAAGAKPPGEIIAYLDTLTPDERAAWAAWMEEPEEIEIPDSVRNLAFTVVDEDTTPQNGFVPTPGLLSLKSGFEIHEDTIDAYIAGLAKNFADHSLVMGSIRQAEFPPGLRTWTMRAMLPEPSDEEEDDRIFFRGRGFTPIDMFREYVSYYMSDEAPENADALIICQLYSDRSRGLFLWWVIDGKPAAFSVTEDGELSSEVKTSFAETIAAAREAGESVMLSIQVLSREDAEKLANL